MQLFDGATWRSTMWNKNDPNFDLEWVRLLNHLKKVIGSKVTAFFLSNYIIIIQKHEISNLAITFEPIALLRWFKSLNNFKLNMGSILFHIVDRQVAL